MPAGSIQNKGLQTTVIFEKSYTKPGKEKIGNKDVKTEWMHKLEKIRNNNFHSYSVSIIFYQSYINS